MIPSASSPLLLINPPFCMPDKPSIAVPSLAAFMKSKGFEVNMLDLNPAVYQDLLTEEMMSNGTRQALERWTELNNRASLNEDELGTYVRLSMMLRMADTIKEELGSLFTNSPPNAAALRIFRVAIAFLQEQLEDDFLSMALNTGYVRHTAPASRFSSSDIASYAKTPPFYESSLKRNMADALKQKHLLVGISATFPDQVLPAFICARLVKEACPEVPIIMGGAYVATHLRDLQNTDLFEWVDCFAVESGEETLLSMAKELRRGSTDWSAIPGIIYADTEKVSLTPPARPVAVKDLPAPCFEELDLDAYIVRPENMALLMRMSMGCYWHRCGFCRTKMPFIGHFATFDPETLVQQILNLQRLTGVRLFHFTDDAAPPPVARKVSEALIAAGSPIQWVVNIRADPRFKQEDFIRMHKAGCRRVYMGVESLSKHVLDRMKKGTRPEVIENVIHMCARAGLAPMVYMMVGFPGETEREARESFARCKQLKKEKMIHGIIYNVFELYSHSPVAEDPEAFGITDVRYQEEKDLYPPVVEFKAVGMSRKTARNLCASFCAELANDQVNHSPTLGEDTLTVLGQTFPIQHIEKARDYV